MKVQNPQEYLVEKNSSFSDRREPRAAFWQLYEALGQDEIEILNFYGIGGIGKTSLLEQLQKELADKGCTRYAYCSLEDGKSKDTFLFQLSEELMKKHKKLKFPIFYYAFEKYRMLLGQGAVGKQMVENASLLDHHLVGSALEVAADYVPYLKTVSSVVTEGSKALTQLAKKHEQVKGVNARLYEEISSLDNDKALGNKLHLYFAVDAYNYFSTLSEPEPLVIFIDGHEGLVNRIRKGDKALGDDYWLRENGGPIMAIPHALWVIAGREKLEWGADMIAEGQAIALDNLGREDALSYFREEGVREETLAESLYTLTGGSPIFMDLCAKQYKQALAKHPFDRPTMADFGSDTDQIANNYLRDMGKSEQAIMYLLSCMPKLWDDSLVTETAAQAGRAIDPENYKVLKNSSFVKLVDPLSGTYSLHEAFRTIIVDRVNEEDRRLYVNTVKDILCERLFHPDFYMDFERNCAGLADILQGHYDYLDLSYRDVDFFCNGMALYWMDTDLGLETLEFLEKKLAENDDTDCIDKCLAVWNVLLAILQDEESQRALALATKAYDRVCGADCNTEQKVKFYCYYSALLYRQDMFPESCEVMKKAMEIVETEDLDYYAHRLVVRQYGTIMSGLYENTDETKQVYAEFIKELDKEVERICSMENLDLSIKWFDSFFKEKADALRKCERFEDAMDAQRLLLERMRKRNDSVGEIGHEEVNLARMYFMAGELDEALRILRELEQKYKADTVSDEEYYCLYAVLSDCTYFKDDMEQALKYALLTEEYIIRAFGTEDERLAQQKKMIGILYPNLGRFEESEQYFEEAIAIYEKLYGPLHSQVCGVKESLAVMYNSWEKFEKFDALWQELYETYKALYGENHSKTIYAYYLTAERYLRADDRETTRKMWAEVVLRLTEKEEVSSEMLMEICPRLAQLCLEMQDYDTAQFCADTFTEIAGTVSKMDKLSLSDSFLVFFGVYDVLGNKERALMMLEEAYLLTEQAPDLYGDFYRNICYALGCLYGEKGDNGRAVSFLLEAYRHYEETGELEEAAEIKELIEQFTE